MAKKIVLGKRPTSFKRTVTFPMPGEEEPGMIELDFKYRTRSEHAAFTDKLQADVKAEADAEVARIRAAIEAGEKIEDPKQAEITARQNVFNAHYLLGVANSWNLDVPLDKESATQLVDELPSAIGAIVNDYRAVIVEGRLGNS
jgi:LytS/YehU family sensor histidine kinase